MHFVYFAEQKLERYYDFLVERTEEKTTKEVLKEGSTEFMESKNAWRRFQSRKFIPGFGTLIGIDLKKECFAEIDPIVFQYAVEPG
jgi:hypothetical protein